MSNPFDKKKKEKKVASIGLIVAIIGLLGASLSFGEDLIELLNKQDSCMHASSTHSIEDWPGVYIKDGKSVIVNNFNSGNPEYVYYKKTTHARLPFDSLNHFYEKVRRPEFYDLIRSLAKAKDSLPMRINISALNKLLEKEITQKQGIFTQPDLAEIFRISSDSLSYNCETGAYSYTITVAVPKYMDSYLQRLKGIIARHVEDILSGNQTYYYNQIIDITNLSEQLNGQTKFKEDLCAELQRNSDYYALFDDLIGLDQKKLLACHLQFEEGEYTLHPASLAILEYFGDNYAKHLLNHPKQPFTLRCTGYTNSKDVKKIIYTENGRWHRSRLPLPYPQEAGDKIPKIITKEDGNLQLSYARAYSGIRYLAQYMEHRFGLKNQDRYVRYEYVGNDVDKRKYPVNLNRKRIEIILYQSPI